MLPTELKESLRVKTEALQQHKQSLLDRGESVQDCFETVLNFLHALKAGLLTEGEITDDMAAGLLTIVDFCEDYTHIGYSKFLLEKGGGEA